MKWARELKIARRSVRTAMKAASAMAKAQARLPTTGLRTPLGVSGRTEVPDFGSNPGRLSMYVHVPPEPIASGAPLVVLLHGCGQTAQAFALDTGWVSLADRFGFPLLLPEQSGDNKQGRCFNWFRPAHVRRDFGEAASIRQMVAAAIDRFGSDPARVYLAGLSAGAAMTAALLAAYPDVFAAGAAVAGLPVGAAASTSEALIRMAEAGPARTPAAWAELVRSAAPSGYTGSWPRLSIWRGEADRVVDPANSRLLAEQWSTLHGLDSGLMVDAERHREIWGPRGQPAVELWTLPDLAHSWPAGAAARIADFWRLQG
jgi:poly(hydroxyalkanoate) depolymerase family esterase